MADERNALAELAERLNNGSVSLVVNDRQVATYATAAFPELDKACRIIAELAKVQVADGMARRMSTRANCLEYSFGNEPQRTIGIFTTEHFPKWICSALNAVEKCREIAENGATND